MSNPTQAHLRAAARNDFVLFDMLAMRAMVPGFVEEPYHALVAAFVAKALAEPGNGYALTLPPRSLKTEIGIHAAAWYLGRDPQKSVLVVSHTDTLAKDISIRTKMFMDSDFYRAFFPNIGLDEHRDSSNFRTKAGGGRRGVSVETSVTGLGADLIVLDDPISANQVSSIVYRDRVRDIYERSLLTRMNTPGRRNVLLLAQRLHVADFTAYLKERDVDELCLRFEAEERERFSIGSIVFEREPGDLLLGARTHPDDLARLKSNADLWETQYQGRPSSVGAGLLSRDDFPIVRAPDGGKTFISWDTASSENPTASFTAALVIQVIGRSFYVIQILRSRLGFIEMKERALHLERTYAPAAHLIESTMSGPALASELQAAGARVIPINPKQGKVERLQRQINVVKDKRVQLSSSMPDVQIFLNEMASFPQGLHSDMVDCMSQFLNWYAEEGGPEQKELSMRRVDQPAMALSPDRMGNLGHFRGGRGKPSFRW